MSSGATGGRLARFTRHNALSLFFLLIFVAALIGQAFAGWHQFNDAQRADGYGVLTLGQYVTSVDFAVDVTENWQSEYLQFLLYIVATVWLVQRGSPESKELGRAGIESDEDQKVGVHATAGSPAWARSGGLRTAVFSRSLALVMGSIFVASWLLQAITGWAAFNQTLLEQMRDPISWLDYVAGADFWARSLQNWQSEFLAVGSMAVFSIYLRQRGSPESKPVGEPHDRTGVEG